MVPLLHEMISNLARLQVVIVDTVWFGVGLFLFSPSKKGSYCTTLIPVSSASSSDYRALLTLRSDGLLAVVSDFLFFSCLLMFGCWRDWRRCNDITPWHLY